MQEGIHILNKTAVTELAGWAAWILCSGFVVLLICFIIAVTAKKVAVTATAGITCIVVGVVCMVLTCIQPEVEAGRYRYEVIMDESVTFSDIYDNYEVIEQRGEIWVLEED